MLISTYELLGEYGKEPLHGKDAYVNQLASAVQLIPDLRLRVLDYAGRADSLLIAWRASGTINGQHRTWDGVDRFRLRGDKTTETTVIFDTAAIADASPTPTPSTSTDSAS